MRIRMFRTLFFTLVVCMSLVCGPNALMEGATDPTNGNSAESTEDVMLEGTSAAESVFKDNKEDEEPTDSSDIDAPVETEQGTDEVEADAVDEIVKEYSFDYIEDQYVAEDDYEAVDGINMEAKDDASMFLGEASSSFDILNNGNVFYVQGKSISASLVANQYNCWSYASAIYQKIWSTSFSSDFTGTASGGWNSLRQMSDSDRRLTEEHIKSYVGNAQLGATLRICGCTSSCSSWGNDGLACGHRGHSVVIVQKDANGFTTVENSRATSQSSYEVWTRYYSWHGFVNYWGNAGYSYIKYIKWPNAPVYNGSSSQGSNNSTLNYIDIGYRKYRVKSTTTLGLNIRPAPSTSNTPLGTLSPGVTISCTKRTNNQINGYYWLYGTASTGITGWITENLDWIEEVQSASSSSNTSTISTPTKNTSTTSTPTKNTSTTKKIATRTVTRSAKYTAEVGTKCQLLLQGETAKSYKSSNKKILTVSSTGLVNIKAVGSAKIEIKTNKKKYTLTIVTHDPTIPTRVSLSMPKSNIGIGKSITLTPVIPYGTKTTYTWKTSNKRVATVTNGTVKFKKKGRVTITCIANRGNKKAKVTFKVNK